VRWGSGAVFTAICILLLISVFIKYPDTVEASVTLSTKYPPVSIKAMSGGNISRLLVQDNQEVTAHQLLAVIGNTANYEDWAYLNKHFSVFMPKLLQSDTVEKLALQRILSLGDMQGAYTQFFAAHQAYWIFMETNFHEERIAQLKHKIVAQLQLSDGISEQQAILLTDAQLTQRQLEADQKLYQKSAITGRELEASEKAHLQMQMRIASFKSDRINANIRVQELEGQILELKQQFREEKTKLMQQLQQASLSLDASMVSWKNRYLLVSPINGRVSFFKFWSDQQFVNMNDELMVILPKDNDIFGYAAVGQTGFGKVAIGQEVRISLNGFPYEEFGMIKGEVSGISGIARENNYMVRISLPNGLHTTYGKSLAFSQEMQGNAQIITEDLRLIERFFYQFKKLTF
jgi:HlyD family secretion protein